MGSFYGNVTVLDVELDAVRGVAGPPAFLCDASGDVVVFSLGDDPMPVSAGPLSAALHAVAVAAAVHDDDLVLVEVHRDGELVLAGAVPDAAEVFDVDDEPGGAALDAADLVGAVGRGDVEGVRAVLAADHVFASDAHRQLLVALGLPVCAAGWGYRYLGEDRGAFDGGELVELA